MSHLGLNDKCWYTLENIVASWPSDTSHMVRNELLRTYGDQQVVTIEARLDAVFIGLEKNFVNDYLKY